MIRLWWTPEAFARTATRCSTVHAALAGFAVCLTVSFLPLSAGCGTISEPYRDLFEYIRETLVAMPVALVLLCILWGVAYGAACAALLTFTAARERVLAHLVLLAPVTLAAPGLIWSVFAALKKYAHPYCGFTGPAGKPAWLESPLIAVLGSWYWLAVGVLIMVIYCVLAWKHAARFREGHCVQCGYNLAGNVSGRCPECGETA